MPTLADLIAQCPPDVRAHIERLETATDPAGLALALEAQRENAAALAARVVELESRRAALSRIVRRALASGQLEKLEDALLYLGD